MDKFKNDLFALIEVYNPEHNQMSIDFLKMIINMIPILPQRTGEWLATGKFNATSGIQYMQCSHCGELNLNAGEFLFCPHCGAKMIN